MYICRVTMLISSAMILTMILIVVRHEAERIIISIMQKRYDRYRDADEKRLLGDTWRIAVINSICAPHQLAREMLERARAKKKAFSWNDGHLRSYRNVSVRRAIVPSIFYSVLCRWVINYSPDFGKLLSSPRDRPRFTNFRSARRKIRHLRHVTESALSPQEWLYL